MQTSAWALHSGFLDQYVFGRGYSLQWSGGGGGDVQRYRWDAALCWCMYRVYLAVQFRQSADTKDRLCAKLKMRLVRI